MKLGDSQCVPMAVAEVLIGAGFGHEGLILMEVAAHCEHDPCRTNTTG